MIGGVWRPVWETGAKRPRIPHHQRAQAPPEQHPVLFQSADQGSKPRFLKVEPPTATDIADAFQKIRRRVIRTLRRLGYLEAGIDDAMATGMIRPSPILRRASSPRGAGLCHSTPDTRARWRDYRAALGGKSHGRGVAAGGWRYGARSGGAGAQRPFDNHLEGSSIERYSRVV